MLKRDAVFIGCDPAGSARGDYSALVAVERVRDEEWRFADEREQQRAVEALIAGLPVTFPTARWEEIDVIYHVRDIRRFPKGTRFADQTDALVEMANDPELTINGRGPTVVTDATGIGRASVEMQRDRGLTVRPVIFTSGHAVSGVNGFWSVPARDLVGVVQVLLQTGRLKIAPTLPLATVLADELLNFGVTLDEQTGHASFAAGRGHDDLVMALAVACWYGENTGRTYRSSDFPTMRR